MRPRVTSVGLIVPPQPASLAGSTAQIDRASLDTLPSKPGIYLFLDDAGMPLYIGKSVNIRSRVQSHLRTPEEASMLEHTRSVDFIRTAGEVGALLLESQLIKQCQPPYNVLLKDVRETFGLQLDAGGMQPLVAASTDLGLDEIGATYGLFASRTAAVDGLRALLKKFKLCPALAGLEHRVGKRACFASQLGHCAGACVGRESHDAYRARLREALLHLQAMVWPFDGPVGIVEEIDGWRQTHVVDRWFYLGSLEGRRKTIRRPARQFIDIDTYKILYKPVLQGELNIVRVTAPRVRRRTARRAAQ